MANPVFSRSPIFSDKAANSRIAGAPPVPSAGDLADQYAQPSASPDEMGRMTYEDTLVKIGVSFAILVAGAIIGWMLGDFLIVTIGAALIGFVLALVNTFKREPSPALVLAYAFFEGIFVGGISFVYTVFVQNSSLVPMAVFGTLGVVGVTLALFASGKVRASKRATKIFLVAIVGYAAFSLVNVVLSFTGVTSSPFGLRDSVEIFGIPLGVPLGIIVVLLAAYSLVLDFDGIQRGVKNGAARKYSWTAAFGLMVTIVWLYLEILRLIAIVMGRR
jgi:uncharacterized YccA/Bax inhibitor family protein